MRVSLLSLSVILGSLLLTSTAILLSLWLARRRRDTQLREHGKPVVIMPFSSTPSVPRTPLIRDGTPLAPSRRSPITALAVAERLAPTDYEFVPHSPDDDASTFPTGETRRSDEVAEVIQGRALRFHRPVDPTRPFLHGYLQVVEGPDTGLELRFVVPEESEEPAVTFGRSEGPAFRHVQLLEPTVSRAHARMVHDGEGWLLTNLSRTNPVSVNSRHLKGDAGRRLRDGDRIEMGTLAFRYVAP